METELNLSINIKEGLGDLKFNMLVEECIHLLGEPDEVETMENLEDGDTIVLYYDTFSLFFDGTESRLSCIDLGDTEATLYGEKVFGLDMEEIKALMSKNNNETYECADEWKGLLYANANIDFYFDELDNLDSIMFGK